MKTPNVNHSLFARICGLRTLAISPSQRRATPGQSHLASTAFGLSSLQRGVRGSSTTPCIQLLTNSGGVIRHWRDGLCGHPGARKTSHLSPWRTNTK